MTTATVRATIINHTGFPKRRDSHDFADLEAASDWLDRYHDFDNADQNYELVDIETGEELNLFVRTACNDRPAAAKKW